MISPMNPSGYYFLGAGETTLNEVTRAIVGVARRREAICVEKIELLAPGQAAQIHPWAPILWGANCRGRADRLRDLGWEPRGPCLLDTMPEMLEFEIRVLASQDTEHVRTWQTDVEHLTEEEMYIF